MVAIMVKHSDVCFCEALIGLNLILLDLNYSLGEINGALMALTDSHQ